MNYMCVSALGSGPGQEAQLKSRDTWRPWRFCSRLQLILVIPVAVICFVDQTSADKMVIAVLKSCVAGVLVFSFCTAGIVKITNKIAPQAYEQMVSQALNLLICLFLNLQALSLHSN